MPRKPKPQPDDLAQSKRFIDMAREIGADESDKGRETFNLAFSKVAAASERSGIATVATRRPKRRP